MTWLLCFVIFIANMRSDFHEYSLKMQKNIYTFVLKFTQDYSAYKEWFSFQQSE